MFVNSRCLYNEMDCIVAPLNGVGGIYLGCLDAAENPSLLQQYNIGAVLSVIDQSVQIKGAQKMWIMAEDADDFPLNKYFEQSYKYIENQTKKTNVLIHCFAGISRSTTLCAAYLMQKYAWSMRQALLHIQSRRRIINPNKGFLQLLKDFEKKISLPQYSTPKATSNRLGDFNNKLLDYRRQLRINQRNCFDQI